MAGRSYLGLTVAPSAGGAAGSWLDGDRTVMDYRPPHKRPNKDRGAPAWIDPDRSMIPTTILHSPRLFRYLDMCESSHFRRWHVHLGGAVVERVHLKSYSKIQRMFNGPGHFLQRMRHGSSGTRRRGKSLLE
jgi:hypothetical protein